MREFLRLKKCKRKIFVLEETGFDVKMWWFYGRTPMDQCAIKNAPSMRSRNISVMATLGSMVKRLTIFWIHLVTMTVVFFSIKI